MLIAHMKIIEINNDSCEDNKFKDDTCEARTWDVKINGKIVVKEWYNVTVKKVDRFALKNQTTDPEIIKRFYAQMNLTWKFNCSY